MKLVPVVLLSALAVSALAQTMPNPQRDSHTVNVVLPAPLAATPENIAKLKLPAGFHIAKFVEGLDGPRVVVVSETGNIYVSSRDAGTITMIDGAGKKTKVLELENVHGMVIHAGILYYVTIKQVYAAPLNPDGTLGTSKLLIADLPDAGQHVDRTLAVGPDNKLYVSVGSTCNTCEERNHINSTMQRYNLDGSGRETFATGLRNTIGFNFKPGTNDLYGWDDGVDWMGDQEQREELNKIEQGKEYGWPYILGNGLKNLYLTPPHGVTLDQWAAKTTLPVLTWNAHASGMQLIFLKGRGLPLRLRRRRSGQHARFMGSQSTQRIPGGSHSFRRRCCQDNHTIRRWLSYARARCQRMGSLRPPLWFGANGRRKHPSRRRTERPSLPNHLFPISVVEVRVESYRLLNRAAVELRHV